MKCLLRIVAVTALLATCAPLAMAWEIPLELAEGRGKAGPRFVSGGVPLLAGQAKDVDQLTLAVRDANGKLSAVPAQFRPLARWWRGDNSLRWVLVDFQTDIAANATQQYVLTDAKLPAAAPKARLSVAQSPEAIVVTTGPARFTLDRKRFGFLASAIVDANGDGQFDAAEELLAGSPDGGTVLEDRFGVKYFSSESTRSVEVIESGPLRVRVRARGVHKARDGAGYSKGMYQYDYLIDFFAGSSSVFADVIIGNNFGEPIGSPCFEDASLVLKLKADPQGGAEYVIQGDKPHAGKLAGNASVCLYQDSNGAATWNQCQGYNTEGHDYWKFPAGTTASFRGYKLWQRSGGGEPTELAAGNQARGTATVRGPRGGLILHTLNFWQQFPKGVELSGDGRVRLALFPREYKVAHFLEDATAKGHEVALHFFAGNAAPDADRFAGTWDSKVLPRPTLEHIAAAGALSDLGPFTVPTGGLTKKPDNRTEAYGSRMLTDDGLYGNAYGWQIFGERWRSCGGHSTRGARQPMNEDDYLYRWLTTGLNEWLLAGDARSRQFRDVRAYRIEDRDPLGFADWNAFRQNNRCEDWTRREGPKDAEAQKYQQGRYARTTFWLPNPAHQTLDLIYDRYLLTGDPRSFENMRIVAAHGGYYASGYNDVHRATGWSIRACDRYWELTGDKAVEALLKKDIANFKRMVDSGKIRWPWSGQGDNQTLNWWFTYVWCRGVALTAMHTRDPDALAIMKVMAGELRQQRDKYKGYSIRPFAEFWAVLYHLTGDEQYKAEVLGSDNGESLKSLTGGMCLPANAHWLVNQKPNPLKPAAERRPHASL